MGIQLPDPETTAKLSSNHCIASLDMYKWVVPLQGLLPIRWSLPTGCPKRLKLLW